MQTIFTVQSDYAGSVALRNEYDEQVAEDTLRLDDGDDLDSTGIYAATAAAVARMIRTVGGADAEEIAVIEKGSPAFTALLQAMLDPQVHTISINARPGGIAVKANARMWSTTLTATK
jgi:hypothetical protein